MLLEGGGDRRSRYLPWLLALALALAAVGLAGPTWQRLPQPVERKTDALVIVFDLSLSMFAEDVAPSRLVRARQKIADVLRRRKEGFTALVVYAGDAHAVVPLTDDTRTIENLLSALRPDMMPVLGSDLGGGAGPGRDPVRERRHAPWADPGGHRRRGRHERRQQPSRAAGFPSRFSASAPSAAAPFPWTS